MNYKVDNNGQEESTNQFHNNFLACVCLFASLSTMLYYPVVELLKLFSAEINGVAYLIFNFGIFAVSVLVVLVRSFGIINSKVKKTAFKGLGLHFLIVILYLGYDVFHYQELVYFLYFFLWSVPALMVGLFLPVFDNSAIPKYLELIAFIMGIASITATLGYLSAGEAHLNTLSFGGTNYQALSYTAAFCVGLELYYIFIVPKKQNRFRLFRTRLGIVLELSVCVGAACSVVISGGRGGMLLLLVNIGVFLLKFRPKSMGKKYLRFFYPLLLIMLITIGGYIFSNYLGSNSLVLNSIERITVSDKNASWNEGRYVIYSKALNLIRKNPFWGYGFFSTGTILGSSYPHNIVLETWINGGFLYFLLWIGVFIAIFKYCKITTRVNPQSGWIVYFLTYTIVFLNCSGTYLWCTELWFLIGVTFSGTDYIIDEHSLIATSQ